MSRVLLEATPETFSPADVEVFRSHVDLQVSRLGATRGIENLSARIAFGSTEGVDKRLGSCRDLRYVAVEPSVCVEDLILSPEKEEEVAIFCSAYIHRDALLRWGFDQPAVLCISGPPGTGKSMMAHAIAARLRMPIVEMSIGDVEAAYMGESSLNLSRAAEDVISQGALWHLREADACFEKRLPARQGSEQATNSLKTAALGLLEDYAGPVVFTTNRLETIDPAFISRITMQIELAGPTLQSRVAMWKKYTLAHREMRACAPKSPVRRSTIEFLGFQHDVDFHAVARLSDAMSGRDIKQAAFLSAAIALNSGRTCATYEDIVRGIGLARPVAEPPERMD